MGRFDGCHEDMTRRAFLKATAVLSFAALPGLARAGVGPTDGRLLVILLRGGLDGLYAVPPIGDKNLGDRRRDLIDKNLLPLDSFFALNPALPELHGFYKSGQLVIVHGASIPYKQRSHFEGQNMMETGGDAPYVFKTGWLGRALDTAGLPAVAMSLPVPLILRGRNYAEFQLSEFHASAAGRDLRQPAADLVHGSDDRRIRQTAGRGGHDEGRPATQDRPTTVDLRPGARGREAHVRRRWSARRCHR